MLFRHQPTMETGQTAHGALLMSLALQILAATVVFRASASGAGCRRFVRSAEFLPVQNMSLRNHVLRTVNGVKMRALCAQMCINTDGCQSFNYGRANGTCESNGGRHDDYLADFLPDPRFVYYWEQRVNTSCETSRVSPHGNQVRIL